MYENGWTRVFNQVDFCCCIRCGRVQPAFFVFDDGSFYCKPCFDFLKGGDLIGSIPKKSDSISKERKSSEKSEDVS